MERESCISIKISQSIYTKLLEANNVKNTMEILYFEPDMRVTIGSINNCGIVNAQIKICKKRKNLLYFFNNKIIPYYRTENEETDTNINNLKLKNLTGVVYRKVLLEANNVRIAVQENTQSTGSDFYIVGEIEYTTENMEEILDFENYFFSVLFSLQSINCLDFTNNFETVPQYQLLKYAPRKFSNFDSGIFKKKGKIYELKKKLKIDGYRGMLVCNEDDIIYCTDMKNNIISYNHSFLNKFKNIAIQVELLDGILVITDIVGAFISNRQYMPEPYIVEKMLDFIKTPKKLNNMRLLHQKFICDLKPNDEIANLPNDGYILFSPLDIYKIKIPTIDARFLNNKFILDDRDSILLHYHENDIVLQNKSIYEITINSTKVFVWRRRFDRSFTSSSEEFETYKKALQQLKMF